MAQLRCQPASAGMTTRGQQHTLGTEPFTTAAGHHKSSAQITGE